MGRPGWDDDEITGGDVTLLLPDPQAPGAADEDVDLLGLAVEVLGRLAARRDRGLGEALVGGLGGTVWAGELADQGAVGNGYGLDSLAVAGIHAWVECQRMELRPLGDSGIDVSEISLGSWLTYSGGVERDATEACTRAAFDAGINFFDTANVYGVGASEEAWGEILSDFKRDSFILATKV
ncbi:MAG: hypothetical protein QOD60_2251 [Solirubrobacterales bacterium]|nr:hypothetical protein [Solirubrobacterales bacterium]